jgi:DNA-binding response OmpR family regulator
MKQTSGRGCKADGGCHAFVLAGFFNRQNVIYNCFSYGFNPATVSTMPALLRGHFMSKILIVEDDASILDSLCLLLESKGYEVFAAGNLADGIAQFDAQKPDLLLTDLNYLNYKLEDKFDKSGLKMIDYVLAADLAIAVVLMTATDRDTWQSESRGLESRGIAILDKPFGLAELLAIIEEKLPQQPDARTAPAPLHTPCIDKL